MVKPHERSLVENLSSILVLPAAFILDLLLGDPRRLPHPIRWMGRAIAAAEPWFRRLPGKGVAAGGLFAALLCIGTWALTWLALNQGRQVHPALGFALETVAVYFCLCTRSLSDAAAEILRLLRKERVDEARARVAMIVGRDVDRYQAPDIARATVETVAENFVDGVLSPLFFAALGGAPLAMAFKMASTLDSMVGYKNQTYFYFGKAAARLDDALNFVPARLSIAVIALAAQLLAGTGRRALRTALLEGANHTSPNAGRPEAAFAGALGVKINGPNVYGGILIKKPFIGVRFREVEVSDIKKAVDLLTVSSFLSLMLSLVFAFGAVSG
jgi:adenosylcobinamide-phosphate synthase